MSDTDPIARARSLAELHHDSEVRECFRALIDECVRLGHELALFHTVIDATAARELRSHAAARDLAGDDYSEINRCDRCGGMALWPSDHHCTGADPLDAEIDRIVAARGPDQLRSRLTAIVADWRQAQSRRERSAAEGPQRFSAQQAEYARALDSVATTVEGLLKQEAPAAGTIAPVKLHVLFRPTVQEWIDDARKCAGFMPQHSPDASHANDAIMALANAVQRLLEQTP